MRGARRHRGVLGRGASLGPRAGRGVADEQSGVRARGARHGERGTSIQPQPRPRHCSTAAQAPAGGSSTIRRHWQPSRSRRWSAEQSCGSASGSREDRWSGRWLRWWPNTPNGVASADRVTFTIRAEQPMRVSVQAADRGRRSAESVGPLGLRRRDRAGAHDLLRRPAAGGADNHAHTATGRGSQHAVRGRYDQHPARHLRPHLDQAGRPREVGRPKRPFTS